MEPIVGGSPLVGAAINVVAAPMMMTRGARASQFTLPRRNRRLKTKLPVVRRRPKVGDQRRSCQQQCDAITTSSPCSTPIDVRPPGPSIRATESCATPRRLPFASFQRQPIQSQMKPATGSRRRSAYGVVLPLEKRGRRGGGNPLHTEGRAACVYCVKYWLLRPYASHRNSDRAGVIFVEVAKA